MQQEGEEQEGQDFDMSRTPKPNTLDEEASGARSSWRVLDAPRPWVSSN